MSTSYASTGQPAGAETGGAPERKAIVFLGVTAFLNLMAMGVFNPVLPFITQRYLPGASDLAPVVGALTSVYAVCQFVAAPGLGKLSDRFGRRPLLLLCLAGSVLGYLIFGLAGALWVLFLGRILDGLTGGNFSILFAYIGDITRPEERGRYYGLFGAAAGAGFILGPALGGFASHLGLQVPVYMAAGLTLVNLVWGYFNLPESLAAEHRVTQVSLGELNPLAQLRGLLALPRLRWLLMAGFLYAFPFAVLEGTSAVLMRDSLGWGPDRIGLMGMIIGSLDILVQGVLVGRLLPAFGEARLTLVGLACQAVAYLFFGAVALRPSAWLVVASVALFAASGGLVEPALAGLTSQAAGPSEQGKVQGGSQAMQALARILGPLWGGLLYVQFGSAMPYWTASAAVGLGICATLQAIAALRQRPAEPDCA